MPNRPFKFETMSADDFEELILDMPAGTGNGRFTRSSTA